MSKSREQILRQTVAAAVAAASVMSVVAVAAASATAPNVKPTMSGKVPTRVTLKLASGQNIELVQRNGVLHGQVLDASGKVVDPLPVGRVKLATGKELKFNDKGQLIEGSVPSAAFLLMCDPGPKPPCP